MLRCGHCKHLTPEYKALGAQVASDPKLKNRVLIAKVKGVQSCKDSIICCKYLFWAQGSLLISQVDADAHRDLGEKFGVRGFPTIKWFKRGAPVSSPEE